MLSLGLAACGEGGAVELRIERPADPALDPLAGAGELRLSAWTGGDRIHQAAIAAPAPGERFDFGQVPIADDVRFELEGASGSGRVVGYGRSGAAVDVGADEVVEVVVPMRRPFVYLSGAPDVVALDATREPGEDYASAIAIGAAPEAVAALPDGSAVLVAGGGALRRVSTSDHATVEGEVAIAGAVVDLAVDADGRWAAASHADGISIVDLGELRGGGGEAVFVPAVEPGELAVGGGLVWAVLDPVDSLFCTGTSSVLAIPVDDPASAAPPVALDRKATDLVVDPATGAAFVVEPCGGGRESALVRFAAPGAAPEPWLSVPGLSAVTLARDRLWVTGHVDGADAHITLASVSLAGGDPEVLDLPTTEGRALATELVAAGQDGLIGMTADLSSSYALSVLPDGEHVAIVIAAVYSTEPAGDAGGGQPIIPEITMVTYEYQLVQLDTGLGAQRVRLSCSISWEPGALLDDFACALAPGQDAADVDFVPGDLSVLYGSR